MVVEIELMTGHAHLAPVLADWHHAEWGHLYDATVWNRDSAERELVEMAAGDDGDLTWVAFDGPGRTADDVLGSVSLVASDELAGFEHVTPWLASLYVRESARGRGVGAALATAVVTAAGSRGHDYLHLFTPGQEGYWSALGWSVVARIQAHGHPATVMARGTHPRAARRAVCSQWCCDPDTNGAYSYLRIGGTPVHRERLRTEVLPCLWLAGEATAVEHPATMQGAWFSGDRAAAQVIAAGVTGRVIVIGAGIAGMVAARHLRGAGLDVVVLEAKSRPGGRIAVDTSLGAPVPLGGAWLHGEVGHPMAELVSWVAEDWSADAMFVAGHGRLDEGEVEQMARAYTAVQAAYAAADPTSSAADTMAATLEGLDLTPPVRAGVVAWLTSECESLYAAPMCDIAANGGFEAYALPGDDRLVTTSMQTVIDHLAAGIQIDCDHPVRSLERSGGEWRTDTGVTGGAVVVTIPIGALRAGRLAFSPPLPGDVTDAIQHLGAGPVTKVFATFDSAWWPPDRPLRLAGVDDLVAITDMTDLTDVPTLVGFAVGEAARRLETLSEHERCRVLDRALTDSGLRDWDT